MMSRDYLVATLGALCFLGWLLGPVLTQPWPDQEWEKVVYRAAEWQTLTRMTATDQSTSLRCLATSPLPGRRLPVGLRLTTGQIYVNRDPSTFSTVFCTSSGY